MSEFLLYVPSNTFTPSGDNTVARFKVHYETPFELGPDWEVALKEIHFPKNYAQYVTDGWIDFVYVLDGLAAGMNETKYLFLTENKLKDEGLRTKEIRSNLPISSKLLAVDGVDKNGEPLRIKKTEFKSTNDVKNFVNEAINEHTDHNKYQFEGDNYPFLYIDNNFVAIKAGLTVYEEYVWPVFSLELQKLLGFEERLVYPYEAFTDYYTRSRGVIVGKTNPESKLDRYFVYVYCNLIKPSFVGASKVNLLRPVEIPIGDSGIVSHRFGNDCYYHSLLAPSFDNVEIELRFDDGELVPFKGGRSLVILHFRRKTIKEEMKLKNIEEPKEDG